VQGHHEILSRLQAQSRPESRRLQARHLLEQRIDHRVADEENPLIGHPGAAQVLVGRRAGRKKPVADRIGHHPIDLFRHAPVAGADAAFDMRHRHAALARDDRTGHGRRDVAHHQAQITALRDQGNFS
jgi:hypothetical protein